MHECKYSGCRLPCKMMCFSSCRLLFEHLNVAVNGRGWATMSYFWMGSRAYVIFSNGVARWKRLGTTVEKPRSTVACPRDSSNKSFATGQNSQKLLSPYRRLK